MKKIILTYGSLLAVIMMISTYLNMFGHIGPGLSALLTFGSLIIVFIIGSIVYKKKIPSCVSFGEYFTLNAGISLFISLFVLLFNIGLVSSLNEDQKNTIIDRTITISTEVFNSLGVPEELIEAQEDDMLEDPKSMFTISRQFSGMVFLLFSYLIIALIVSAILNKVMKSE